MRKDWTAPVFSHLRGPERLFLRLFEKHALFERRVELHKLDLAFNAFLIFTRPNDVIGLRGLKPEQAIL